VELPGQEGRGEMKASMDGLRNRISRMSMLAWNRFKITENFILETRVLGDWVHRSLSTPNVHRALIGCCEGLTKHFGILWNGDMVFCCVDYNGKTSFGNIKETTIKQALAQKRVQEVRGAFGKFKVKDPYCQRCLGDASFDRALVRQIGSILYFKLYRPLWENKWQKESALL